MPGQDFTETIKLVSGVLDDLLFIPELPDRGAVADMIGRTLGLITELPIDLQPSGWRLASGDGADHRRAAALLAHDLDIAEEVLEEYEGTLKQQIAGPLTLVSALSLPRGEKVLSDHGARRDLAEALAEGIGAHVSALRRRFASLDLVIQVDEPGITAVLDGSIPTSSGFGRYRTVGPAEADAMLRILIDAITGAGARAVVHSCAPDVPVGLLADAGFSAIGFDIALARPGDAWAEAFDSGVDLWVGAQEASAVEEFMRRLGYEPETWQGRMVVTPPCGLATFSPVGARGELARVVGIAGTFS